MEIKIGNRIISQDAKPYFIADLASNHDGSLDRAYQLIELAKEAGADAAKFQNFKAGKIVSRYAFDRMPKQSHQAGWNKSVYEVYQDASLPDSWTEKLKEKCDAVGIEYMTSPYDMGSADMVDQYVNAFKIGSGDITWTAMLEYLAKKGKPVLLATGACDKSDVDRALGVLLRHRAKVVLMQCNTNYTADVDNFKHLNLNVLKAYSQSYPGLVLGLSDHTPGHTSVLGALALGARVFEKHFTDDNGREGPDHKFAMNPSAWRAMVRESMYLYEALGDGCKRVQENEKASRIVQQRSLYFQKDMEAGETVRNSDIFPLRPIQEGGYYPYEEGMVVGKKLAHTVRKGMPVLREDLVEASECHG